MRTRCDSIRRSRFAAVRRSTTRSSTRQCTQPQKPEAASPYRKKAQSPPPMAPTPAPSHRPVREKNQQPTPPRTMAPTTAPRRVQRSQLRASCPIALPSPRVKDSGRDSSRSCWFMVSEWNGPRVWHRQAQGPRAPSGPRELDDWVPSRDAERTQPRRLRHRNARLCFVRRCNLPFPPSADLVRVWTRWTPLMSVQAGLEQDTDVKELRSGGSRCNCVFASGARSGATRTRSWTASKYNGAM